MAKALKASSFTDLDIMDNLKPRPAKAGSKDRRVTNGARNDLVSDKLAECNKASEVAALATQFGLSQEEIMMRGKKANNFGQFRMVLGNRMRGVVQKLARAKERGIQMTAAEAAYKSVKPAKAKTAAPAKKAPTKAPAPAAKKPAPAPAKKPAPAKAPVGKKPAPAKSAA